MPRRKPKAKPTILSLRHELSPVEYTVFSCMLRGLGLAETARCAAIPQTTAFDRRKAVLKHCDVETQAELIALVLLPFLPERVRLSIGCAH